MSARTRILGQLRSARPTVQLPPSDAHADAHIRRHATARATLVQSAPATLDECLTRFAAEAAALGVDCHIEASAQDVRQRLAALLDGATVTGWAAEHLPYQTAQLLSATADVAEAAIGVTGCDAAIAETASLVMFSAPGRSRLESLLPATHIAIVERRQLCFSMAEVFARYREQLTRRASCTIITGPSRTADIELTLTLGIHGPARVVVVIGP